MANKRVIVGISGASGVIYGVRLLEVLSRLEVESHLVVTRLGEKNLELELNMKRQDVERLATRSYELHDLTAPIASGGFRAAGMVVAPCSMKTLAGIARGYSDNLLLRAADVTLKERRPLILVVREMPLNTIHLKNMLEAAEAGAIILPAAPAFYHRPKSIDDLVNHVVGKVLDLLNIEHDLYERWRGYTT
ncbi:aromatic acid decarboxylase [Candidatus Geothermarchaeota archaeon ex4572_27]|nr:MAG: aromatic acid decarboxylase [Candidatus Geothermarchaeota archaeon ex4572_27]